MIYLISVCLLTNCTHLTVVLPVFCKKSSYSAGFARSFGMRLANGERREWIKPIMFSGGLGSIEDAHVKKEEAETGNGLTLCVKFV